jgi:hypothetical protein
MVRLIRSTLALFLLASAASAGDSVLLSTRREGWLEAFRLDNLESVARVRVRPMAEGVQSDPEGQRLFVRMPHPQAPDVCCALFALDTRSMRGFAILWPVFQPVRANGKIFAQRGDDGIEVFDARALMHLPTIMARGVFQLAPSPDGHWLFGTKQFPTPALDIFDVDRLKMVRSIGVPGGQALCGVWIGSQYYLFALGLPGAGQLWPVSPDAESLGKPRLVRLASAVCPEPEYDLLAAGDRIVVYSGAGSIPGHGDCLGGGYLLVDPAGESVTSRLAPELHFNRLLAGPGGKALYGIVAGTAGKGIRLVKIETASGQLLAARDLPQDVWRVSLGSIPAEWQGRLDLTANFQ